MRLLAMFVAAALSALCLAPAYADPITSIVVFGDSLSDNGNTWAQTGVSPGFPYAGGYYSNGPVAVQQMAVNMGLPLLDFAYGGATTGTGNNLNGYVFGSKTVWGLPGMETEAIDAYQKGLLPTPLGNSLVVVWGGANDFGAITDLSAGSVTATAKTAAANVDAIVSGLQGLGATHILVPNLPDLSKTPGSNPGVAAAALLYSDTFNGALAATLPAGATLFDTDALFQAVLKNPGAYGMTNTTDQCVTAAAYPSCTGYLFFDSVHPTTAADSYLAAAFQAAMSPSATPEPSSLVLLGTGLLSAAGLLRRRHGSEQD